MLSNNIRLKWSELCFFHFWPTSAQGHFSLWLGIDPDYSQSDLFVWNIQNLH